MKNIKMLVALILVIVFAISPAIGRKTLSEKRQERIAKIQEEREEKERQKKVDDYIKTKINAKYAELASLMMRSDKELQAMQVQLLNKIAEQLTEERYY